MFLENRLYCTVLIKSLSIVLDVCETDMTETCPVWTGFDVLTAYSCFEVLSALQQHSNQAPSIKQPRLVLLSLLLSYVF